MFIMNYNKHFGQAGEAEVKNYLINEGYKILATNFTVNHKVGEIDIIAKKGNIITFVEVKARKIEGMALICQMVPKIKQKKIITMAMIFLQRERFAIDEYVLRFDIALIVNKQITYFENAFVPL